MIVSLSNQVKYHMFDPSACVTAAALLAGNILRKHFIVAPGSWECNSNITSDATDLRARGEAIRCTVEPEQIKGADANSLPPFIWCFCTRAGMGICVALLGRRASQLVALVTGPAVQQRSFEVKHVNRADEAESNVSTVIKTF